MFAFVSLGTAFNGIPPSFCNSQVAPCRGLWLKSANKADDKKNKIFSKNLIGGTEF